MEKRKILNRVLSLVLAICLAVGMVVIPPAVDGGEHNHVHAASGSTEHNCNIASSGSTLTQAMMDAFVAAGTIDVGEYNFSNGPLFVYATEDISWSGEVLVPDGVFIAVCTAGHSYEMGTVKKAGETGGVYMLDCSVVTTEHVDCQAYPDNTVIYMTQAWIDLYVDWAARYAPTAPLFSSDQYIALAEDVHIRGTQWLPPEGVTLNVCTNGKTFTTDDGVDISTAAGTVNILDGTTMPKVNHNCTVAGEKTIALTQENISEWLAKLELATASDYITFMHLAEDIVWDETITAPDGVYVAICLNGFTLDAEIDNSGNETGGLYTYTCQPAHVCEIGTEKMETITVTQEIVDFMEIYMSETGGTVEAALSLGSDVTFSAPEVWRVGYNGTLTICRNGYEITDNAGLNLSLGSVIYYDCNSMTLADVNHESPMFGSTYPMSQETLNDFSDTLGSFIVEGGFWTNSWNYWSFIGNDGNLYYMPYYPIINADGTLTPSASSSYPDGDSFVMQSVYDENGSQTGYGYQVMVPYENDSSSRSSKYLDILPVLDENGASTGKVTIAFTDSYPTAVFNYSSTYGTYTATVDGVEYYLGSPDGSAVIAACPVTKLASGGKYFANNRMESRYNGSDGMFSFHLTEDIVWDESIVIPDNVVVVIATNGHTVTGNYTHGDKGGVYVFDDAMHPCLKAGDGVPVMAVCEDFIELMLLMSGGEIEMEGQNYIALSDDISYIDPRFTIPAGASLYICVNGHTISEEALATLRAGGALITLMDCSEVGHDCSKIGEHEPQFANTQLFKDYYQDSNGVFALGPGEYYVYLYSNVNLSKTLVIPDGVTLHLCLNGFTLKSPVIVTPTQNDEVLSNECYGAILVQEGGSLTVYDCSEGQTGLIKINNDETMTGWGALAAYAVCNSGTFVLDSGNLMGMMTVINSGDLTVNGGNVAGVLAGVAQAAELSETVGGTASDAEPTLTMNGGEIAGAAFGVIGMGGDVNVEGGAINAGYVGIASGLEDSTAESGANISLSGCEINIGTGYEDNFAAVGYPLEGEDLGISTDSAVGVIASGSLSIDDDVVINVDETIVEDTVNSGDIMLGVNSDASIQQVNGEVVGTPYKIIGDGDKDIPTIKAPAGSIEVEDEMVMIENSSNTGENTITIVHGSTIASVAGSTISTTGLLSVNIYASFADAFTSNENARIILTHKGVSKEYKVSDGRKNGSHYIYSMGVNAKDYSEDVSVTFTDGNTVWGDFAISINTYLDTMIADTSGTYDEVKEFCRYIKNYCMAASFHFGTATEYIPEADIAAVMDGYTPDKFVDYAYEVSGSSENVTFAGSSLLLESGTRIRLFFSVKDGVDVSTLSVTVDGRSATLNKRGSYYYVDIDNIAAKNLATFYTVDFDGVSVKYAALSYAWYALNSSIVPSADLVDVCEALLGYYNTAYAYANR